MSDRTCHITPDLISDYVADRLDDDDARVVEEAIEHNDGIAAAVATARQVNSRMARSFATVLSH
jgi:anti-sigma factor RsiW